MASNRKAKTASDTVIQASSSKRGTLKVQYSTDDGTSNPKAQPLTENEKVARTMGKQARMLGSNSMGMMRTANYGMGDTTSGAGGNFYSPQLSTDFLEKPQNLRERRAWYRHFYYSNELVGAAIDLHSTIPLSKIRLLRTKCQNEDLAQYSYDFFVDMCDRLHLFKRLQEISHEWWLFGSCAPKGSIISARDGFRAIETIKVGDEVLSHNGRFCKVNATSSRHASDILSFKVWCNWKPLQVTSEHPVEVLRGDRYEFVKAGEIKKGDFIKISAIKETKDVCSIDYVDDSRVIRKEYGYDREISFTRSRNPEADRVRNLLLNWLSALKEPTVLSWKDMASMFSCKKDTLGNVMASLNKSGVLGEYKERIGADGFAKGSRVVWNPTPWAAEQKDSEYLMERFYEFHVPHTLEIDEDFLYLVGYWLGDGTMNRDIERKGQWGRAHWDICFGEKHSPEQYKKINQILLKKLGPNCLRYARSSRGEPYTDMLSIAVKHNPCFVEWWSQNFGETSKGEAFKRIPSWVRSLPESKLLSLIGGLLDSDGCLSAYEGGLSNAFLTSISSHITRGFTEILSSLCIPYTCNRSENRTTYLPVSRRPHTIAEIFRVCITSEEECRRIEKYTIKKFKDFAGFNKKNLRVKEAGGFLAAKVRFVSILPPDTVYNLEVGEDHTYSIEGFSTHNCATLAEENNPYPEGTESEKGQLAVHAGKERSKMLLEKFKITDKDPNYLGWDKITILPPDQVKITKPLFSEQPLVEYLPDPMTKEAILRDYDDDAYANLSATSKPNVPKNIKASVMDGGAIPLDTDPDTGTHVCILSRKKSQYEVMGVSILERCVNTLLIRDKLRQAQTSIASRHMTPIRLVWADEMSEANTDDLRMQVDYALMDPDYSIVTNFEVHWEEMGSSGRLLDLSSEYDHQEQNLYTGLGVTKELLTGEGLYSGNKISLEILNIQYMQFRDMLQDWIENNLFKPVARKKGFVEYDKFGRERLIYPKVSFTRMSIRDADSSFDQVFQLYQKGSVSIDVILEMLNIDPDITKQRLTQDLLTVNDSSFNAFLQAAYGAAGNDFASKTNISEKLAMTMGLDFISAPPPDAGAGGGDAGGGLRFASDPETKKALESVAKLAAEDPELLKRFAKMLEDRKAQ